MGALVDDTLTPHRVDADTMLMANAKAGRAVWSDELLHAALVAEGATDSDAWAAIDGARKVASGSWGSWGQPERTPEEQAAIDRVELREVTPRCDHCGKPDGTDGEADWNGDTGNHLSCEQLSHGPVDTGPCPEWCGHGGDCALARDAIQNAERYAETAPERHAELGLSTDRDLEEEAADEGLQELRDRAYFDRQPTSAAEERRASETFPVLDPDAPCAWCDSDEHPRIQRGPAALGWQCEDGEACAARNSREQARRRSEHDAVPCYDPCAENLLYLARDHCLTCGGRTTLTGDGSWAHRIDGGGIAAGPIRHGNGGAK